MEALFSALFAKITAVLSWFVGSLLKAFFIAIWFLFKDVFFWLFEQVMALATFIISAIDVSGISGLTTYGSIPADVMNILGLLGLGQAIVIITTAIGIRFVLQLIPFVRLGS